MSLFIGTNIFLILKCIFLIFIYIHCQMFCELSVFANIMTTFMITLSIFTPYIRIFVFVLFRKGINTLYAYL